MHKIAYLVLLVIVETSQNIFDINSIFFYNYKCKQAFQKAIISMSKVN